MVSLRQAYEKVRRPSGIVRRGRLGDVPVELYHEIDEVYRRVFALQELVGANNESIAAILGNTQAPQPTGEQPGTGEETPPAARTQIQTAQLLQTGSAGATSNSLHAQVLFPFSIESVTFQVTDSGTNARPFLQYDPDQDGVYEQELMVLAANAATTFPRTFPKQAIEGQQQGQRRLLQPGLLRLRITNASPVAQVFGSMTLAIEVPVGV